MKVKQRRLNGWQRLSLVPLLLLAVLMLVLADNLVHQGTAHAQAGFGACVVRDGFTSLPSPPSKVGPPVAGSGYAIKTVSLTSDVNTVLALCTDQVYKGLMGKYKSVRNTNPAQWQYAVYDANGNFLQTGCAQSGCEFHQP